MKKRVLITGGGSKFGFELSSRFAEIGFEVDIISSTDVIHDNINSVKVDWSVINEQTLKKSIDSFSNVKFYDIIIFNHNTGGGPNETMFLPYVDYSIEEWTYHYFINCQIPFIILKYINKKIKPDTKIVWMISGLVDGKWDEGWKYSGYASFKSTNVHLMRGFSKYFPGIFLGMNPGHLEVHNYEGDSSIVRDTIINTKYEDSGKILYKTGHEWSML